MLWHTHTACLCFLLCAAVNAQAVCVGHEYLTIMGCTLMLNAWLCLCFVQRII